MIDATADNKNAIEYEMTSSEYFLDSRDYDKYSREIFVISAEKYYISIAKFVLLFDETLYLQAFTRFWMKLNEIERA